MLSIYGLSIDHSFGMIFIEVLEFKLGNTKEFICDLIKQRGSDDT